MKVILNGKELELKDLRNEKVSLELEDNVERTDVDFTELQKLPRNNPSLSGTMNIKKNTENYRNMMEFFEDCKAKALLETFRDRENQQ